MSGWVKLNKSRDIDFVPEHEKSRGEPLRGILANLRQGFSKSAGKLVSDSSRKKQPLF